MKDKKELSYKDTYCPFFKCTKFNECEKAYIGRIYTESKKTGTPVLLFDGQPECFEKQ